MNPPHPLDMSKANASKPARSCSNSSVLCTLIRRWGPAAWPFLTVLRAAMFALVVGLLPSRSAIAQQPVEVALAGFAYSGSAGTIDVRFPFSRDYEEAQSASGKPVHRRLWQALTEAGSQQIKFTEQISQLRGRDQAIAVALVIGAETVSSEQFGNLNKLLVLIRGQAMFFDFKSMNIVRAYPISFAYVDLLDHAPTKEEIRSRVKMVYEGANNKPGILTRFATSVAKASIPAQVPRLIQVTSAQVKPEVMEQLPAFLKAEPAAADTWLADMVSEAVSTRAGIPIIPFAKGYAVGNVMSMRVSDGTVWELKLPKPDYAITAELTGFKKVKYSEIAGGATSFVYGAFAQLKLEEPLSQRAFISTALKNGETRVIPASQKYVDDFPHYYDAINGLLNKLALVIDGRGDEKWLKGAAAANDIERQISQTRELIKLCK